MSSVSRAFYYATEGDGDAAVACRLLTHVGFDVAPSPGAVGGKRVLDRKLSAYARSATALPWLILRDLDHDGACPSDLVQRLAPNRPPLLVLRIAVRAIESWLLSDDRGIAAYLRVPLAKVPRQPDQLDQPKQEMVRLARFSGLAAVRRDMVPEDGGGRPTGKVYTRRLVSFARDHWDPERARKQSTSLDACIRALVRVRDGTAG